VDRAADVGSEDGIDPPVLLDPAQLRELRRHHLCPEMVAPAVEVGDISSRTGYGGLDALLELVGMGHEFKVSGRYTS
jgi:hypothetical protein